MSLLAAALGALLCPVGAQPPAKPLPEKQPEEFGVMVDGGDAAPEVPPEKPAKAAVGEPFTARGRLLSIDPKTHTAVVEIEEGDERRFQLNDATRLSFARDNRPLLATQLKPGDPVSVSSDGKTLRRLHLELCGEAGEDVTQDDIFVPSPRQRRRHRAAPRPEAEEDEPERNLADEPDTPMYQSEPETPVTPRKDAPAKK